MTIGHKTIHLGERKSFLERLDRALDAEHAIVMEIDRRLVGAHEVLTFEVQLADGTLFLEEDAFLGKSLTGPKQLVDRLAAAAFGIIEESQPRP